ncbi:MAG: hypothetical protein WCT49_04485 [Candidatus Paceibacterota bacterium]|jgi:hypothetical protein|nr:hypothetical protein [Candidatus Paceibacterota bacterium]
MKSIVTVPILNKITRFLVPAVAFFVASPAFSAQILFQTEKTSFSQNEEFLISAYVDTEGEMLNAYEGKIIFPAQFLEGKEVRDGNSLVNFWIERPSLQQPNEGKQEIVFSGITPGGFSGAKGFLFSIIFRTKQSGTGTIQADRLRFLKNDGKGSPVPAHASSFSFAISSEISTSSPIKPILDDAPPEDFMPFISNDPNIFDGKNFLVFSTQDKDSGIDHYEVREGNGAFVRAESPYLLKDQSSDADIEVKAVDKKGNERTAKVSTEQEPEGKQKFLIFGILLVSALALIGVSVRKKIWKKSSSN